MKSDRINYRPAVQLIWAGRVCRIVACVEQKDPKGGSGKDSDPVFFKTTLGKHHRCCCKSPTGPMCTCSSLWCKWTNSIHRYVTTCSTWISHSSAWLTELTGLPEQSSLSSIIYMACLSQASITEWIESKSHNMKPWTYKMEKGRQTSTGSRFSDMMIYGNIKIK